MSFLGSWRISLSPGRAAHPLRHLPSRAPAWPSHPVASPRSDAGPSRQVSQGDRRFVGRSVRRRDFVVEGPRSGADETLEAETVGGWQCSDACWKREERRMRTVGGPLQYVQRRYQELESIEARGALGFELWLQWTGRRYRRNAGGSRVETRGGMAVPRSEECIVQSSLDR